MGTSAAFFDLDKTVIAKSSALAFGKPFYRDGLITRREAMKAGYAHLAFKINGADDASIAKIRDYLAELSKGWSAEQVRQIVDETLHELIKPYVYAEAAALIAEHQANGRDVVLVSASGEEFVRPIGAQLDVSDVIATRMRIAEGVYTGEIDFYAAGPGKVAAVKELAAERGYDLADCYAYSDSISDAPLLEIVGNPTAVNPDRALRKLATERSWQILEFRRPVPLGARVRKQLKERPAVPVAAAAAVGVAIGIAWYGHHRKRTKSASADPKSA